MNNLEQLFIDRHIPFENRGSQVSRGWIGLTCPFCGDGESHLGYNMKFNVFSCWRCGIKPFKKTLSLLLNVPFAELEKILPAYYVAKEEEDEDGNTVVRPKSLSLPSEAGMLQTRHKRYLKGRGFNPSEVEKIWGLKGTMDEGKYSNRIIIPIYHKGKLCSFTTRDITDTKKSKAVTCPKELEVIPSKHLLHGFDLVKGNTVAVMEGPFDAMKFGPGAIDTLGVKFSEYQAELLGAFKNIFIVFDSRIDKNGFESEKAAQQQAEYLADTLSIDSNVWIIDEFKTDPGAMTENQIKRMKKIINETLEKIKED